MTALVYGIVRSASAGWDEALWMRLRLMGGSSKAPSVLIAPV
jgi:hypothetical protein